MTVYNRISKSRSSSSSSSNVDSLPTDSSGNDATTTFAPLSKPIVSSTNDATPKEKATATATANEKDCCAGKGIVANDKENNTPCANANHCTTKETASGTTTPVGTEKKKNNDDNDNTTNNTTNNSSTTTAVIADAATVLAEATETTILSRPRESVAREISKKVLRHKLQKLRHLVLEGVISEDYLERSVFHPKLLDLFDPQTVVYNGGIASVKEWKISCYLEVMEGGIPCTNPNLELLDVFLPLLETCDDLFLLWYKQQHACNKSTTATKKGKSNSAKNTKRSCRRLMTFVTRYTPAPGEQALLKHIDGAGKVDGSCVVALPVDRWSAPHEVNSFYGHGGGLTFWDGREAVPEEEFTPQNETRGGGDGAPGTTLKETKPKPRTTTRRRTRPREIHYETRSGDIAFIDRAVWHQADPITKGTRWALVVFYKVTEETNGDDTDTNHEHETERA